MVKTGIKEVLIEKYRLMLSMRLEREALEAQGILKFTGESSVQRRASSKELARQFPGALKELDRLSSATLERKLEVLEQSEGGDEDLPLWAKISYDFHQLLGEALAIKSWLAGRKLDLALEPGVLEAFAALDGEKYRSSHWPQTYRGEYLLQQITNPPGGRLSQLVWEVLQERFGLQIQEMKTLAFGMDDD